eukprot:TRINITY_DN2175_c0_g1_i1.p1 TRINITY_DN2175_c0_g1~~TRINITY_DN2175_c0_g1_i1.p1  ORF type:complete len:882 (+),score=201.10 TRINITY_DN2175_c0_g1_i1:387-2648(+)
MDAECGWCYATNRCLPRRLAVPIAAAEDRCGFCDDFTADTCSTCAHDCSGHGSCQEHSCLCEPDWTDVAPASVEAVTSCRAYAPSAESHCRANFSSYTLNFSADAARDIGVETHYYRQHVARVAFEHEPQPEGTVLYIRYGKVPVVLPPLIQEGAAAPDPPPLPGFDVAIDLSSGAAAVGSDPAPPGASGTCFSGLPGASSGKVMSEVRGPALAQYGSELWMAVARRDPGGASYRYPDVAVKAMFMVCDRGFAGDWCEFQRTLVDFEEVDDAGGEGSGGLEAAQQGAEEYSTRRFSFTFPLYTRRHAHLLEFGIEEGTVRLAAWLAPSSVWRGAPDAPLPTVHFRRNGVHVDGRDPSAPLNLTHPYPGKLGYWAVWVASPCAAFPRHQPDAAVCGNAPAAAPPGGLHPPPGGLHPPPGGLHNVTLNIEVTECGYRDPGCGGAQGVNIVTPDPAEPHITSLSNAPWPENSPWLVLRLSVTRGVRELHIRATTTLAVPPKLYVSYMLPPRADVPAADPQKHVQYATGHDPNTPFVVTDPPTGYWYVALYAEGGAAGDHAGSFHVESKYCVACKGECVGGTHTAVEFQTETARPRTHALPHYTCIPQETAAPPTPAPATASPATPLPATTSTPGTAPAQEAPPATPQPAFTTTATAGASGATTGAAAPAGATALTMLLVGLGAGMVLISLFAAGIYGFAVWKVRRDQRRREHGGYDPAPGPYTIELEDDEDAPRGAELSQSGGDFAFAPGDASLAN